LSSSALPRADLKVDNNETTLSLKEDAGIARQKTVRRGRLTRTEEKSGLPVHVIAGF
jgi:hypothetical protein